MQYYPPLCVDEAWPSLTALTDLFTLAHLTRLTVSASWIAEASCTQLFSQQHRFEHRRCLELVAQQDGRYYHCPQTDAALLPLVKPADVVVPGRAERQAVRAARRPRDGEDSESGEDSAEEQHISADSACNFPALECLALPFAHYNGSTRN